MTNSTTDPSSTDQQRLLPPPDALITAASSGGGSGVSVLSPRGRCEAPVGSMPLHLAVAVAVVVVVLEMAVAVLVEVVVAVTGVSIFRLSTRATRPGPHRVAEAAPNPVLPCSEKKNSTTSVLLLKNQHTNLQYFSTWQVCSHLEIPFAVFCSVSCCLPSCACIPFPPFPPRRRKVLRPSGLAAKGSPTPAGWRFGTTETDLVRMYIHIERPGGGMCSKKTPPFPEGVGG